MATLEQDRLTYSMSSAAMDMIDCFYDGMDKIVTDMAQRFAEHEKSFVTINGERCVAIEKSHVQAAWKTVNAALRKLVHDGQLHESALDVCDQVANCCEAKSRQ